MSNVERKRVHFDVKIFCALQLASNTQCTAEEHAQRTHRSNVRQRQKWCRTQTHINTYTHTRRRIQRLSIRAI